MKVLIAIGIIFLCLNILRFVIGNYQILKLKNISTSMKVWNIIESLGMSIVLVILIINYYK